MKRWYVLAIVILTVTVFGICGKDAQAQEAETHTIGELKITHESGEVKKTDIYAKKVEEGTWNIWLAEDDFWFYSGTNQDRDSLSVQFTIWENAYFNPESVTYNESVTIWKGSGSEEWIEITGDKGVGVETFSTCFFVGVEHAQFEIESFVSSATKKGFHPSKKNYLIFRSVVFADIQMTDYYDLWVEFNVTDSKGNTVYMEDYADIGHGVYLNMNWDGKDEYTKKYVKDGVYKAEVSVVLMAHNDMVRESKSLTFKVSRKASKGTKGLAKAKDIVMLTGNPEIDYMAAKMVKAAGVKMSMSDEQKVKKIYHYMTKKFKHTHYTALDNKYKAHYNLKKLQPKIVKYFNKTVKLWEKGELIYNYQYGYTTSWCMQRRRGVCDDHAEIFKILCNHVGVEAGICGGYYLNRDGSKESHAWNYAIVNGKKYYYDVDVEIQNYKKGQGDYYWYKKTKKQAKKNHKFKYEA